MVWCYKTSHNASPCFPSTSAPSGEQEQVSLWQTSGINLLSSFYVIYIYSFQCRFSQQNVYKIMARKVFFSNNPLYFSLLLFCYQHRNLFEFKIIWFYFNPLYSSSICRQFTKKNVHVDDNSKTSITPRKEGSSVREKKNQIWRNATVSIYFIPLLLY